MEQFHDKKQCIEQLLTSLQFKNVLNGPILDPHDDKVIILNLY